MIEKKPDLTTKYLGLELRNPIIVGSSGLTRTVKGVRRCAEAGAGAVVLKSIFEEQIIAEVESQTDLSQSLFQHPETNEYLNTFLHEHAVSNYLDLIKESKKSVSIPVIASINCMSPGRWIEFAKKVEAAGADALELNVFALPTNPRLDGEEYERIYFKVLSEVKHLVKIPVSLKVGYFFSGMLRTLIQLSKEGADGLVLFNRFYSPDIDVEEMKIVPASVFSSPSEIYLTLRWIAILSGRADCDLAATTGIHDGTGVVKQILAGAQAVEISSVLYKKGVKHIETMLSEIENWMTRHKFGTVREFCGKLSQNRSEDPAAYERVQFMKLTTGIE